MPPKKRLRGPKLATVDEEGGVVSSSPSSSSSHAFTSQHRSRRFTRAEKEALATEEFANEHPEEEEEQHDDEDVVDTVRRLKIREGSREKTPRNREEDRELSHEKRMRKNVVNAIRQAFQARGDVNHELSVSTQKLITSYKMAIPDPPRRTKDLSSKFFQELDVRLGMMLEEVSVMEHRAQVYKTVALTTMEELKTGNEALLDFLLEFLGEWCMSTNVAARINSTSLIAYIFETAASKLPKSDDKFVGLSLKSSETLFRFLKRSLTDREFAARVPAIRALGTLQKYPIPSNWSYEAREMSPRELLMRSFRDVAWECRLTAIQCFVIKEQDVVVVSDIIQYDKCLKVRLGAIDKLGDLRPSKNVREKIQLLDLCFKDHDVAVRDQAKKMLEKWIKKLAEKWSDGKKPKGDRDIIETDDYDQPLVDQEVKAKGYLLAAGALQMLWLNDSPDTVESHAMIKKLTQHLLDVVRHLYMCHMEPINAFAETLAGEMREQTGNETMMIITKSTIGNILEQSEMLPLMLDTQATRSMVFFWRCIVEYMVERKRNEGDKLNALSRFLCPLKTLTEHFFTVQERLKALEQIEIDSPDSVNEIYIIQMSIIENFLIVMRHAPKDQAGLDAYQKMLISMLCNPCYQKKIVDIIVADLSEFYSDCPEDFLSLVYAKCNELKMKFKNSGGRIPAIQPDTVLVGEKKILANGLDGPRRASSSFNGQKVAELHELMVINSLLKCNILETWGEEYEDRYGKMFRKNLTAKDIDRRVLSIECIGLIGVLDLEVAEKGLGEALLNFSKEEEAVQSVLLNVLCDLAIFHSVEKVNEIMGKHLKRDTPDLLSLLTDIIIAEDLHTESELLMRAVEGLSKVLLNRPSTEQDYKWQKAVVSLMFRASYRITNRFSAKIRSVIIVMLKFFCSLKRSNQMLLIKSFGKFFDMWSCTTNPDCLALSSSEMIPKLKRCASTFVALTRHSVLPPEEQKSMPAHVELVNDIFAELTGRPDSMSVEYYLYALHTIEYESFSRQTLTKIYGDLESYIGVHEIDTDKHRYNELRRLRKKIAKILGINAEEENVADETVVAPSRSESRAGPGKPRKAPSVVTIAEEEEEEEVEEEEDEEEETVKPPPARKGRPPRSAPTSVQKKKKEEEPMDLLASPQRNPRKPPSRQNTGTRPAAPSASATRTAPPRSARRLRSDK